MAKHKKTNGKNSHRVSRFNPKVRKEVTNSELKTLEKTKGADSYFLNGEKHRIEGELKQAVLCYKKALQIDPEYQDSLFFMGFCYLPKVEETSDVSLKPDEVAQIKKAVSAFEQLIAIREKNDSICWEDYPIYYYLGQA